MPEDPRLRLNTVCPYYTMFPLDFPERVLRRARRGAGGVLDPFSGRGTTLFAARLQGLAATGVDSSPVAAALSMAKLAHSTPKQVINLAIVALKTEAPDEKAPVGDFWSWAYHSATLTQLARLRGHLVDPSRIGVDPSDDTFVLLRALALGALHGPLQKGAASYLSNQMPRTYASKPASAVTFWEKRGMRPPRTDVLKVLSKKADFSLARMPPRTSGSVLLGDSRHVLKDVAGADFSWVVTSPPYLGMRTYVSDQWLRNWLLGGAASVDYSASEQLGVSSVEGFLTGLAEVWRQAALASSLDARLVMRIGALPSLRQNPAELARQSLIRSELWEVTAVRDAGAPQGGSRQARQFKNAGAYVNEVDVYAKRAT